MFIVDDFFISCRRFLSILTITKRSLALLDSVKNRRSSLEISHSCIYRFAFIFAKKIGNSRPCLLRLKKLAKP